MTTGELIELFRLDHGMGCSTSYFELPSAGKALCVKDVANLVLVATVVALKNQTSGDGTAPRPYIVDEFAQLDSKNPDTRGDQ
jgi:hypothetical protein